MQLLDLLRRLKAILAELINSYRRYVYRKQLAYYSIDVPEKIIALSYGPEVGRQLQDGATVTGGRVKLAHLHHVYPHSPLDFNILYLVSSALPKHSIELVHWAKRQGVKFVLNQNGVGYPAWTSSYHEINAELLALTQQADLVVYQSKFCFDAAEKFVSAPDRRSIILPNCVDIDLFHPEINQNRAIIRLLVSGTHYQKERVTLPLVVLNHLLKRGHNAVLSIAGRLAWDDGERDVGNLIRKYNLQSKVELTGPYTNKVAPQIYSSSSIFLHLKYKDPCPNVVIEALASGLPIVASNSGGLPELVGDDGGILVDVADDWNQMHYPSIEPLVGAVEAIIYRHQEYSIAARQRAVTKFSSVIWVKEHSAIFSELIGSGTLS